uniref:RNA-directed RNA polymerase n=1 Tax=Bremia lactucae associated fusagravirus 1 TaxID=2719799 RepID=A0A6G9ENK4_9VIRU|nr:MAG: RNA-dependent RNA polymerase [Bremia lactucae associated fusagravirus 1]
MRKELNNMKNDDVKLYIELLLLPNPRPKAFSLIKVDKVWTRWLNDARSELKVLRAEEGVMGVHGVALHELNVLYPVAKGRAGMKCNLLFSDVVLYAQKYENKVKNRFMNILCKTRCNWTNTALANWLLFLCHYQNEALWCLFEVDNILSCTQATVVKYLKVLHTRVRATHTWPYPKPSYLGVSVSKNYHYLGQLMGRHADYHLDAAAEMWMRAAPGPGRFWIDVDNYGIQGSRAKYDIAEDRAVVDTVEGLLKTHVLHVPTFEVFWNRFLSWASSGSAPGFRMDIAVEGGSEKSRMNKRLSLAHMDLEEVLYALSDIQPVLHSRFAVKYENEKNRALWNTSIVFYIIGSYLLHAGESRLDGEDWCDMNAPSGARLADVVRRIQTLIDGKDLLAWDYADFNLNHELQTQCKLWRSYTRGVMHRNDNPSTNALLGRCCKWMCTALENTILEDVTTSLLIKVSRSMMTGTRGTAFTNTLLNGVYGKLINRNLLSLCGEQLFIEPLTGRGDDMISGLSDALIGACGAKLINMMGFAGQEVKVLMGNVGEFLRQHYTKDGVGGYPARACAGLVAGEYFAATINNPYERYAACVEQVRLARKRSLPLFDGILGLLKARNCRLVGTVLGKKHSITVDERIVHTRVEDGGMGVYDLDGYHWPYKILHCRMPKYQIRHKYLDALRSKRTANLASSVYRYGGSNIDANWLSRELIGSCIGSDLPPTAVSDSLYHYMLAWLDFKPLITKNEHFSLLDVPAFMVHSIVDYMDTSLRHRTGVHHNYGVLASVAASSELLTLSCLKRMHDVSGLSWPMFLIKLGKNITPKENVRLMEIVHVLNQSKHMISYFCGDWSLNGVPTNIYNSSELLALCRASTLRVLEDNISSWYEHRVDVASLVYSLEYQALLWHYCKSPYSDIVRTIAE